MILVPFLQKLDVHQIIIVSHVQGFDFRDVHGEVLETICPHDAKGPARRQIQGRKRLLWPVPDDDDDDARMQIQSRKRLLWPVPEISE
jgi:hypothetical protein